MTNVTYRQEGRRHVLRVEGHAGHAAPGTPDIVCAGISALCCALAGWVCEEGREGRVMVRALRQDAGDVLVDAVAMSGQEAFVTGAFEVVVKGLGMLGEGWPNNVQMTDSDY